MELIYHKIESLQAKIEELEEENEGLENEENRLENELDTLLLRKVLDQREERRLKKEIQRIEGKISANDDRISSLHAEIVADKNILAASIRSGLLRNQGKIRRHRLP
jgi:predicted RNase H-like nuclease (RuvC/YqgF family)